MGYISFCGYACFPGVGAMSACVVWTLQVFFVGMLVFQGGSPVHA